MPVPAEVPARLKDVLVRAETVIAETRRVIRALRRNLSRQRAAARLVLRGQPRVARRQRPTRRRG